MRLHRVRFTVRRMMVVVGLLAVPLAITVTVYRELERVFPSSPASWARQNAFTSADMAKRYDRRVIGVGRGRELAKHYDELADGFERYGIPWAEPTYYGPYTDILPSGRHVIVQLEAEAKRFEEEALEDERRRMAVHPVVRVPRGTVAVIERDGARDEDECPDKRCILLRLVDGPQRGELLGIERVYLRRSP